MAKKEASSVATEKSKCPISRKQFDESAEPIAVKIGDFPFAAVPKQFSTGSMGWNVSEKMTILIDGKPVKVQVGLNLTVVGSKELPK